MTTIPDLRTVRRVLVTGGRAYHDQHAIDRALDEVFAACGGKLDVVHGGATGADACAHAWVFASRARGAHVGVEVFMADWRKFGKSAGPIRNRTMFLRGKPDLVLAFPGGDGTADCVAQAAKRGVPILFRGSNQKAKADA